MAQIKSNLSNMWKTYLVLEPILKDREIGELFFPEMEKVLELASHEMLVEIVEILYDNKIDTDSIGDVRIPFIDGIQKSGFYDFVEQVKRFK